MLSTKVFLVLLSTIFQTWALSPVHDGTAPGLNGTQDGMAPGLNGTQDGTAPGLNGMDGTAPGLNGTQDGMAPGLNGTQDGTAPGLNGMDGTAPGLNGTQDGMAPGLNGTQDGMAPGLNGMVRPPSPAVSRPAPGPHQHLAPPTAPPTPGYGCHKQGVGFSARKAAGTDPWHHVNGHIRIRFKEVLDSYGPHSWDSSKFCPHCPGHYFFSFHAQSSEDRDFTLALMMNGAYKVTGYGTKNGYHWASNSAMIYLHSYDCVWLELQQGTIYEHPYSEAYTTFTGFLVAP